MTPLKNADGERFYAAVGQWSLEGFLGDGFAPSSCVSKWNRNDRRKFANCYSLNNGLSVNTYDEECSRDSVELATRKVFESREFRDDAQIEELLKVNASGAWLNGGVRSVAGAGFEPATLWVMRRALRCNFNDLRGTEGSVKY
jgi:hypothetical protein